MNEAAIWQGLMEAWDTEPHNTPLGNAIYRLKNPAALRYGDGPWLLEGFVAFFTAIRDASAAITGSDPQPLAPHCFDVNSLAHFFSLDPKDFAQARSVVTRRQRRGRPTTDEIAVYALSVREGRTWKEIAAECRKKFGRTDLKEQRVKDIVRRHQQRCQRAESSWRNDIISPRVRDLTRSCSDTIMQLLMARRN